MEHRNRHGKRWCITDHLYYKKLSFLFRKVRGQQKICSNYVHYFSAIKFVLVECNWCNLPQSSTEVVVKYAAFLKLSLASHELPIWISLSIIIPLIYSYPASLSFILVLPSHTVVGVPSGTSFLLSQYYLYLFAFLMPAASPTHLNWFNYPKHITRWVWIL